MPEVPRHPRADAILLGDNLDLLPCFADESFQLIYIDPPFNTGRAQTRQTLHTTPTPTAIAPGFRAGATRRRLLAESSYATASTTTSRSSTPRLSEARRLLAREGTLYFHIDYREAHYCKLLLDELFGRECFLNEIIWAYDYGARTRAALARQARHDPRLRQATRAAYHFDSAAVDREPYMAPGLVTAEKAARGKLPTDVWWHTIVPTSGAREDRLPDAEAPGDRAAHGPGLHAPGRLVPGLLRGQRHARRGRRPS